MIIEKDIEPGWYIATTKIKGKFFAGAGQSHTKAMERCFEKIKWFLKQ